MPEREAAAHGQLKKEAILFAVLLSVGIVLLPVAIYLVGQFVFGSYGGGGYLEFHGDLFARLWSLEPAALFLVLSPYLLWQALRYSIRLLRGQRSG